MDNPIKSKQKRSNFLVLGICLLFMFAFGALVMTVFLRGVFVYDENPNWGIFAFGAGDLLLSLYLARKLLAQVVSLSIRFDEVVERSPFSIKRISIKEISSIEVNDTTTVKSLWISITVPCATIRSADQVITFLYDNYHNADEMKKALEKLKRQ